MMDLKSLQQPMISRLCNVYSEMSSTGIYIYKFFTVYKALLASTSFTPQGCAQCMLLIPFTHEKIMLRVVNSLA